MSAIFRLDRPRGALFDAGERRFDTPTRAWTVGEGASGETVDAIAAARWLQRDSGAPIRVPVGVIGPRKATRAQLAAAEAVGAGLADIGFPIICGGRDGVMEAVCKGASKHDGTTIGVIGDVDPALANPHVRVILATGIGEARNALIARAALCLVAIGDSFGTLSEVALGRHFGKLVIGLEGAAPVDGVVRVTSADEALAHVALFALNAAHD